jgi:hypothetical protein
MSAFNYARIAATAVTLLSRFGTVGQLGTEPSRDVLAVRVKDVKQALPDSDVQIGDIEYFMEPAANPIQNERWEFAGESLILAAKPEPVKPASVVVGWTVWGRAG